MIRVVIVDERVLIRESLKTLLMHHDQELEVVGASACHEICCGQAPDVLLFILNQSVADVWEAFKEFKKSYPKTKSIVMEPAFTDETLYHHALQMGVDGYVLQDITPDELVMAIKGVSQGLGVVQRQLLTRFAGFVEGIRHQPISNHGVTQNLTDREREFIRLIAEGKSNKEIASILCVALGTVKNTISGIFEKLQRKDRTQLAIFAVQNNLIQMGR